MLPEFDEDDALEAQTMPAAPLLRNALKTYQARRSVYGPSEQLFGDVMRALFPNGLTLTERQDWVRYGLFHHVVGKLCRYAHNFQLPHVDSIHDIGVYSFMLEAEDRRHLGVAPFEPPGSTS